MYYLWLMQSKESSQSRLLKSPENFAPKIIYTIASNLKTVLCSCEFSTLLTLFLEHKTSECFLMMNPALLFLSPILFLCLLSTVDPTPSRSFQHQAHLIISLASFSLPNFNSREKGWKEIIGSSILIHLLF